MLQLYYIISITSKQCNGYMFPSALPEPSVEILVDAKRIGSQNESHRKKHAADSQMRGYLAAKKGTTKDAEELKGLVQAKNTSGNIRRNMLPQERID